MWLFKMPRGLHTMPARFRHPGQSRHLTGGQEAHNILIPIRTLFIHLKTEPHPLWSSAVSERTSVVVRGWVRRWLSAAQASGAIFMPLSPFPPVWYQTASLCVEMWTPQLSDSPLSSKKRESFIDTPLPWRPWQSYSEHRRSSPGHNLFRVS